MSALAPVRRDPALDVLRGWAIVLMITSHIGLRSHVGALVNLPYFLDPAGPFVLLAGIVLGMGARAGKPVTFRRVLQLFSIHVAAMTLVLVVHESTGRLRAPSIAAAGGFFSAAWKVLALRLQALDFMNILPLFVVFFTVAPLLVAGFRRGAASAVLALSVALWGITQFVPGWWRFTDPAVGPEAFVLPAWQAPFVLGLGLGFHRDELAQVVSRRRTSLLVLMGVVFAVGFVVAQLQRNVAAPLGARLPASVEWVFAKPTWGPGRALYTLAALGLGHAAAGYLEERGGAPSRVLAPLALLGRKSLYCFLVHLPLALAASAANLDARAPSAQDVASAASVLFVYAMARFDVLGRVIPG